MMDTLVFVLLLAAAVCLGLIGGLFFAFSGVIMNAFDRLPVSQAINVSVLNPAFLIAFFGTAVFAIGLAAIATSNGVEPAATFILMGAVTYLLGTIPVTIVFNVPLNKRLARLQLQAGHKSRAWRKYRVPWTGWNHVRTVASPLATAAFGVALVL